MDPDKVHAVDQWPIFQILCSVDTFIGTSNNSLPFIEGFSRVVHPLIPVTKMGAPSYHYSHACSPFRD
jgi:hypothetical protein